MIKISKSELREKFIQLMELGLTNVEIATRLNEEFNADETNSLTAIKVGQLKDAVGLKGWKPKKKSLFELVDDEPELIANDEFLTSPEANPEEVDQFIGETYRGVDL